MRISRIVCGLSVLALLACEREPSTPPVVAPSAAPPEIAPSAPAPSAAAPVASTTAPEAAAAVDAGGLPEADPSSFAFQCTEHNVTVRLTRANGEVRQAHVVVSYPGDGGSDTFDFELDHGKVTHARLAYENDMREKSKDKTDWWMKGTIVDYTFGAKTSCTQRVAEGPGSKVMSITEKAPAKPTACPKVDRTRQIGERAALGASGQAELKKVIFSSQLCN